MALRRTVLLAALTAALFRAAGASANTSVIPATLQCDNTFASGSNTHAPFSMPLQVKASILESTGLRVGAPTASTGTRMGLVPSQTLALWRFDSASSNVTATVACTGGGAWTVQYQYSDENGSSPMDIGTCGYTAASCTNGVTQTSSSTIQLPVSMASCPASPPSGATLIAGAYSGPLFATDSHFADSGNAVGAFTGVQLGSVPYNSPTGNWDMPASYTLSAWFKSTGTVSGLQRIVGEEGPLGFWGLGLNGNGVRLRESREGSSAALNDHTATPPAGINLLDGGWHKIDVTRTNGVSRRFYVDGRLAESVVAASSSSFSSHPISHPVVIGAKEGGTESFNGSLDEVRILQTALNDDDILLEYAGTLHRYSSNDGVSFSTVAGSFNPAASNGATTTQTYFPGQTPTATSVWVYLLQSVNTVTNYTSQIRVTVDTSKPIAPGLSASPTSTTQIGWSWITPSKICVAPGTPAPGPYYQLADCASGATVTPASSVFEPTRLISESYGGTPNQLECRELKLTDVWGPSDLSAPTTTYTLAAAPNGVSFTGTSITTGSFLVSWNANSNPSYTRYEVSYSTVSTFTPVSTRTALGDNLTATSVSLGGLLSGTTYWVRVRAYSGRNGDFYGDVPTAFASGSVVTIPPAPTLTATALSNSSINWSWTLASGATGYTLLDSSNQAVLFAGPGNSATVGSLSVNARYDAEVQVDLPTPTPASARGHAFTYTWANAPVGLTAATLYHSSATFTWGENGNPAGTFYQLIVSSESSFGVVVATLSVSGSTLTATNLFPGSTYYARVRGFNGMQTATAYAPTLTFSTAGDPLTSVTQSPSSPYVPPSGLVGAWQFDEGTGTTTVDGAGLNLAGFGCYSTLCASTPTFTDGSAGLGKAASFGGISSAAVLTTGGAAFDFIDDLTVEAWVKPQSASQLAKAGIVARGADGTESFALDVSPLGAYRFLASGFAATVSTTPLVAGQWTHVVGVFDSGAAKATLYLNGTAAAVATGASRTLNSGEKVSIGNRRTASGYTLPFLGAIDSVRLIHRALTAAEVRADYTGSFVSSVTPTSPTAGVIIALPPNAFSAPAEIFVSADPVNHPIRVPLSQLNSGLAALPSGLTLVPNSLIEVVPVVGGAAYTSTLGSSATVSIPFTDADGDNVIDGSSPPLAASSVAMYTLNTTVNRWELLPTVVDGSNRRASGQTPHFSVFALLAPATIGSGLSGVVAYPIPWKPGSGGRFDGSGVTFARLPTSGKIRILTLAGRRVREFTFNGGGAGTAVWDGQNDNGTRCASGVYFAKVESDADRSSVLFKIAVER